MIYVATCRRCSSQDIIPFYTKDGTPLTVTDLKFYCTGCGQEYTGEELVKLYVAS